MSSTTAAAFLRTLAATLPEIVLPADVPYLAAAETRLAAGIPALDGEPLLTGAELLVNAGILATALGSTAGGTLTAASMEQSLSCIAGAANELAPAAQCGSWDLLAGLLHESGIEGDTVITLLDHAARPALRAGAAAVREAVGRSRWNQGICPACGETPLLGELRGGGTAVGGAEQERVLRCGRCLSAWNFPRMRCVVCGETEHRNLSYLHGSGEGAFRRAEVCSTCGHYIKSIAVLSRLTYIELLEIDLATAALDVGAVEHGFHR